MGRMLLLWNWTGKEEKSQRGILYVRQNARPDPVVSHPGEFLKEMLEDLGTSQAEFARTIGVSSMRVSHVIKGTRPVTAELALLFGKAFGQSPQYWLNLQAAYDLQTAERAIAMKGRLRGMRPLAHA